ncbi:MAG: anion permease, partial [Woeseia sp.]
MSESALDGRSTHQTIGLILGPVLALTILLTSSPGDLSIAAWRTAAMALLMAVWWATEAVPIAVTALLPLVAFPLLGIADMQTTSSPYA